MKDKAWTKGEFIAALLFGLGVAFLASRIIPFLLFK